MKDKLTALRNRLVEAQRKLLLQAAESAALPPDSILRKISDLESTISATEVLIEEYSKKR